MHGLQHVVEPLRAAGARIRIVDAADDGAAGNRTGIGAGVPRRLLLSVLLWRALAGVLWRVDGESLLRSRRDPAALALTHAFTLGVLGNAMV